MKAKFGEQGHDYQVERGDRGIFDVLVDGRIVFSKHDEDRFPMYQEIPNKLIMEGLVDG